MDSQFTSQALYTRREANVTNFELELDVHVVQQLPFLRCRIHIVGIVYVITSQDDLAMLRGQRVEIRTQALNCHLFTDLIPPVDLVQVLRTPMYAETREQLRPFIRIASTTLRAFQISLMERYC